MMDDQNKKVNQKEIDKDGKIQITDEEAKKVAAGADFWFWDDEKRKPKGKDKQSNPSNGG